MLFHTSLKMAHTSQRPQGGTGQSQMAEPHGPQNLPGVAAVAEAE